MRLLIPISFAITMLFHSQNASSCFNGTPKQIKSEYKKAYKSWKRTDFEIKNSSDFLKAVSGKKWIGHYYSNRFAPLPVSFDFDSSVSSSEFDPTVTGLGYFFERDLSPLELRPGCVFGAETVMQLELNEKGYFENQKSMGLAPGLPKRHLVFAKGADFDFSLFASIIDSNIQPNWVFFDSRGGTSLVRFTSPTGDIHWILTLKINWIKDKDGTSLPIVYKLRFVEE